MTDNFFCFLVMKEIFVAFLLYILCQATAAEPCNVTIVMSSTNPVKVGENVTISCSLVNTCETAMIHWSWSYSSSDKGKIRVSMNHTGINTSYAISPVKESDNGTYECVANINGSLYMDNILLIVKGTNVVNVQVQPHELKYNTNGMISCFILLDTAIGPNTSDLVVLWYHNNDRLNSTMDLQQINDTYIESKITINNSQLEDAGDYTCNVPTGNDYVMDTQSVCVFGFIFIEISSHTNLMVGSRAEIHCGNVSGVTYTWRGPTNQTLPDPFIISSVYVSDDQSTYTCTASIPSNPMNCQTEEESIVVDVIDTFVENVTITTTTLVAGNHDVIICEVYLSAEIGPDYSSLTVKGYRNGINVNSYYSIMKLTIISGITFKEVEPSNAGTYTCSAVIRGGNTKNSTKDICVNYPKLLVDPYTNLTLGSNTIINCRAMDSTLSDISVYWIDSNNIQKQNPLNLSPVALSDNNTIYTCFISSHQNPNSCIPQNHTIEITIKDTFVEEITIFPTNFIIGTPEIVMCGIVLNIEIGPDVSSLLVEWYHNNNSIGNNTLGYTVSSLAKRFAKESNSTLKISQVEASHSGNYTCVARIGEENQKKSSKDICVNYQQLTIPSSSYTGLTLGDNVNIPCTSQELKESEATVTWIDPNNHTLHNPLMLSPVSVSHNNTRYTCNVRIHGNPSSCENNTQDIIITIKDTYVTQVIITTGVETKPNNLLVGQLAIVNCNTDLNTDIGPDMSSFHKEWYHNDEIIITDIARRGVSLQLLLKKVKTSHAGYYECLAWIDDNTLRNKSDNILLYVNLPTPLVTIDSKILQVYNTSTSLDLTCSASISSSESPYVDVFTSAVFEWRRYIIGGSEFSEIFLTSQNNLKIYTSSLSLHNINLSSAGEYTCDVYLYSNFSFVKNSTRKSNKTTIRIKVPTPVIILNTTGAHYNVGTLFILSCKIILRRKNIDVNTMATIKLYKKDILRETRMIPVVTEGENLTYRADFHFSNIKLSDSGIYKCQGFVDDDINSSFIFPSDVVEDYITINVKIPTPEIILNTSDVYYDVGSSLVLSCQMILLAKNIDNDTIAVFELKSNFADVVLFSETSVPQVMSETKFIYTVFFLFNVLKLSSAGEYTCTGIIDDAMNSSFIIQSNKTVDSGSIFIKMPIGSPINCTNTTFLPRTVTLVWTEPEKALQNGEISGYYLECRIDGSETQIPDVNITQDNPDTNYTIPVLIPFTSYRCLLTAINQVGQGPSTMCVFTTAQDIPENAPENFYSTPSRFNITFTWLPPSIPNGIIIQYNLTVDNINTGTTITHVIDSTQDHYTVEDFKPYQRYSASLSAGTVAGYGPPAYVSGRTEPDIPGAVSTINVNVLNISTIQITWSPVAQEETNGNITHYIVFVSLYEGRDLYNRDISVSSDLQVIVNGLAGEIPYGVTVKAVNDIGQEGQSNTTVLFTRENVPPTPTNISVLRLNGTHMNISWSLIPITKARGFIQSYFILYRQIDNRKRQILSVSVPATDSSVVISELDPDKSYSVLISASTNAGQGAFTSEVVVEESKSSLFQLRAEPFTSCEEWTISTENSIKSFIRSAVVDTIQDYCECGFLDSFITNESLFCDTQNPTQAVYRAKLFNFGSISSTQIVSWIEDWVLNGASVTIGLVLVTFDPTCPVSLNSINDGICELPGTMSTSIPTIVTTQSTSSVGVIAGSALAVVFIVLTSIVLIIIVTFYFHLKSKKGRLHVTGNDEKNPGDVNIELESNKAYSKVEFPPDETVDHTYESLENYENVGRDDVPQELNGDTSNQPVANVN